MSNLDFNPSGVIPLAQLIRSQIPDTSSPETPPPIGTPSGGLPAGAPTGGNTPSGLGTFFGNIGSGLAGLARSYFAAGQPSVWGQGAQQVDESGMIAGTQPQGAQQVDESGMTTGAAQPGQPSQMQPRPETQWPPSPVKLPPAAPPPSETPPEARRAPPRQDPYIPSRRDAPMHELGRPDLAEQGAVRYPGLLPGPYMPQPHEWRGIMQGSTRFLGNMGSGTVAPLARLIAGLDPAYWKAKQSGDEHRAKMAAANFALYSKQLAQQQAQESRDYAGAFAAYGPHDGKPGDEDALREEITKIAAQNNDTTIMSVLNRGGIPAVERLIRERDAHGKDASKVLIQQSRWLDIELKKKRLQKLEDDRRAKERAQYPFLVDGGAPAAGTPGAMGAVPGTPGVPADTGGDEREFLPAFGGKSQPAAPAAATPADDTAPPEETAPADDTTEKETPETPEDTPEKTSQAETPEQPETPETPSSPSEQVIRSAQQAITPPPTPSGTPAAPRTAARETGTVSDAPQPGALPQAERLPQTAEAGAPSSVPAAGTPAAMGATAPVPSLQQPSAPARAGAVPMEQAVPGQVAGQQELPPVDVDAGAPAAPEWQPTPSRALQNAANRVIDTERGPMRPNVQMIETLAQRMVNGTVKIQELRNYPEWMKEAGQARGLEILEDMKRLARDPNVNGKEQVLAALNKINPEFALALKGYVQGDFDVPSSAWANPAYKNNTIALGQKMDPGFNQFTAKTRAATMKNYSAGPESRNLTALATAYRHLTDLREQVQKMGPITRAIGGVPGSQIILSPQQQAAFGALRNAINTATAEYERVLIQGKPTVTGRKEQAEELPIRFGPKDAMIGNINDKIHKLQDRGEELKQGYIRGTGLQPQAMIDGFERALQLSQTPRSPNMLNDEGVWLRRALGAGERGTTGTGTRPPPSRPATSDEDAVDYRSYFGR